MKEIKLKLKILFFDVAVMFAMWVVLYPMILFMRLLTWR